MNSTLQSWNALDLMEATQQLLHCCAANRWAGALSEQRPFDSEEKLFEAADSVWSQMNEPDWMEAFAAHPRIGERKAEHGSSRFATWSQQEQASTNAAEQQTLDALARCNLRYEEQFGFTYIICATGKSADEMLRILSHRLNNDRRSELREAAEQQRQITQIRLRKWLAGEFKV
jgi:OHCU decarboxylase